MDGQYINGKKQQQQHNKITEIKLIEFKTNNLNIEKEPENNKNKWIF